MSDIFNDPPPVHYDDGERFGTAWEMIAEIKRLRADRKYVYGECARHVSDLADNVQELKLCMGEMTAQELRTLSSGLRLAAHKIRLLRYQEAKGDQMIT